ncbi:transcriptional activator DEMETER-like isoform X2 [Olea europaea var. sylvestris]|uniref:transcriptional activator DEMETER-like isoform X2 n=1 Tax=Olea europaea var. sylvestris TaxID=158386 RepID=UPI000C1CEFB6|nr:transcriptional activator DEMETER-like isoform X2 [Olea europaea var. sylvestris]
MSLGRGFSIPRDKGVIQNGDPCIPLTPDKPILKRSEMQPGSTNWQDLLGMYTGFLQDETCNGAQQTFTRPGFVGQNQGEFKNRDVGPIREFRSFNQNSGNGGSYIQNLTPTGLLGHQNHGQHSNRDVALTEKFGSFNQHARPYVKHSGNDIPQKVNSLVELLGTKNAVVTPPRVETANRNFVVDKTILSPHSQVLTNRTGYKYNSSTFQQNHTLYVNKDVGSYSLQQIPTDGNYRSNYNLNLPTPRTEAGASTRTVRLFQLGPVTPDQQNKSKNFQPTEAPQWSMDKLPIQENDDPKNVVFAEKQSNQLLQNVVDESTVILKLPKEKSISDNGSHVILSRPPEIVDKQSNQTMQNIVDESTSILQLPKEKNVFDDGNYEGIDLNKTPQQKPPRRRKHRPKVVVEEKPKKTPKPATPKNNSSDGIPSGKRKYVRKKDVKTSTTQLAVVVNEVGVSNMNSAAKSCRRMINFDLENGAEKESEARAIGDLAEINEKKKMSFSLNLNSHNAEGHTGFNGESTTSSVKEWHQNLHNIEKQQTENLCIFDNSGNHTPLQLSLPFPTSAPPSTNHTLNVIARNLSMRNANTNQRDSLNWYCQVDPHVGGGHLPQFAIQTHTNETKVDGRRQPMLQAGTQLLDDLVNVIDRQQSKREYSHTKLSQPDTSAMMGSQLLYQRVPKTGYYASESNRLWQDGLETSKRKKVEDKFHVTSSSTPSSITVEYCSRQVEGRGTNGFSANKSTLHLNGGLPYSDFEGRSNFRKPNNEANKVTQDWYMNPTNLQNEFQQQLTSSRVHSHAEQIVQKVTFPTNKAQSTNSLAAIFWNQESSSQRDPKITQGNEIINSSIRVSVKGQTARLKSFNQALNMEKVIGKENKTRGYKGLPKNVIGSLGDGRHLFSVDDIIDRLKSMSIKSSGKEIFGEQQGALVPYKQDGAIVLYEEFDPIKKRRPRPKVDLDPETNRLWNLLMGKEGSESTETMDQNKEKWWEEERKVFRGRVDSFIARMHLVQGDRRFSKWKGSVVDSVIGVFLTQNVSDHLSSSAFMCLAAKFPLKSTIIRQPCCQNGGSPSVEELEVQITCPDGTITYDHGTVRQPVYNHGSVTSSGSCQYRAGNVVTGTRTFGIDKQYRRADDDIISSQSSSESLVLQANEDIRSSSGSNSEAEDQISGCNLGKNSGPLNLLEQAERMAALQEYQHRVMGSSSPDKKLSQWENPVYNLHHQRPSLPSTNSWSSMTTGLEEWESNFLASPGKESISSLASTDFENTKITDVEHAHYNIGQSLERSFLPQQTGRPDLTTRLEHTTQNNCLEPRTNIIAGSQSKEGQHSINCHRGSHKTIQQESNFLSNCTTPAEAFDEMSSGLGNSKTKPMNQTGPTASNARKTKVETEKKEAFHWDELRKQAQLKVGKRERCEETMDSLDYEALRKADVREISETIKERGMNNMLAERIKDFLNRLVEDHGGIDLEWLRDVPPEKSKDYLLSIRGLGLKSVECVRLLTLHNLAFPVDTNVGRIAVRLGWVPLQPLPEELQLHLLELYPVLESIQKYLWPRLCKLDQKTLYELHYQMITFGKVFCTKKQPNCNACPMRGECRHFASAFASARLALPGPEEKCIVASTTTTTANKNPGVTIKPMALPQLHDSSDRETGQNCDPIIEEPTTPEPPLEVSESDIEDAFYEDPDEIPTIKLNIEQFATNLQSFMQDQNVETQEESNLSKALVSLRPEFASIPTPKLKSVSRLRTEHQVYELPDNHPLLKGMERRETDDPSPYLLAIWTPGETADSIQPPKSKCSHQELDGLCDKKMCFSCSSIREEQTQTVRGTLLIPCRTAMRGSFPLNGTYFQVNEVFADHESSLNPINVPRNMLWSLPRRTVFFGTSVSTIFKGLTTEGIQYCFWKGFVCVRGFEQKLRAPRPLVARLHYPASKMAKKNEQK